jgi:predicted Zn-dependent protease
MIAELAHNLPVTKLPRSDPLSMIDKFEAMLAAGKDTPLLRFSLGSAYLMAGDAVSASPHLQAAVVQDPQYSAAWKLLGKALTATGETTAAVNAYTKGISAAEAKGDKQAAKEMSVFLNRLQRPL